MLHIENVSKDLGEFKLDKVTLDIKDGEYLVIIGPTGAGKTILLETVAGVYPPDSGKVFLNKKEITYEPPKSRNITMVYQDYMLFPHLNVEENIGFGLKNSKQTKENTAKKIREVAELFNISHLLHRYPDTLSGGEQQRVAVARAIAGEPGIILADEPTGSLDSESACIIINLLQRFHRRGATVIVATHDKELIHQTGGRIVHLDQGRMVLPV